MDVLHSQTRYVSAYIIKRIYDTESRNHSSEALSILEQLETRYSPVSMISRLPITPPKPYSLYMNFAHLLYLFLICCHYTTFAGAVLHYVPFHPKSFLTVRFRPR